MLFLAFLAMLTCLLPSLSKTCLSMTNKSVNCRTARSMKVISRRRLTNFGKGDWLRTLTEPHLNAHFHDIPY